MKFLKTFFSILLLFIVISLLALIFLVYWIDPNKLKPVIAEQIQKKTGYAVLIQGKLSWSFYPRLAINVRDLTVADQKQGTPFLDLHNIKIGIELAELTDFIHYKENLQGLISIDELKFNHVHAEHLTARLRWQKNGFTLDPLSASLYGGTMEGRIEANHLSSMPYWKWDVQFNHIQLKPFLDDMHGKDNKLKLTGSGQFKSVAETAGKTKQQILNQLNGMVQFSVDQGVLEGIDFNYYMQAADALLNRQPIEVEESGQTIFNALTGTATIKQGIAHFDHLLLVSPVFKAESAGSLILSSQTVDMEVNISPQQTVNMSWKVPLVITGNIKSPSVRLDVLEIQKFIVKKEIDKIKDKARDQVKKHIPGKTGEFIQHLLSN